MDASSSLYWLEGQTVFDIQGYGAWPGRGRNCPVERKEDQ